MPPLHSHDLLLIIFSFIFNTLNLPYLTLPFLPSPTLLYVLPYPLNFSISPLSNSILILTNLTRINLEMAGCKGDVSSSASSQEASLEKKYGGIVPKKKPLISKDNERAYFDSADWALGKQGSNMGDKSRAAVESLRPKLERTPRHQLPPRRPACTTGGENRA